MNSAPDHKGHCPECDRPTYTCYDELCEDCFDSQPVICSFCLESFSRENMHSDTKCKECHEFNEQEKREIMNDVYRSDH